MKQKIGLPSPILLFGCRFQDATISFYSLNLSATGWVILTNAMCNRTENAAAFLRRQRSRAVRKMRLYSGQLSFLTSFFAAVRQKVTAKDYRWTNFGHFIGPQLALSLELCRIYCTIIVVYSISMILWIFHIGGGAHPSPHPSMGSTTLKTRFSTVLPLGADDGGSPAAQA